MMTTIPSLTVSKVAEAGNSRRREAPAEDHQREDLEQHLGADHRGVAGRVVLRRDLDHVAADDVDALEAMQDRLGLARGETAGLRCPGAGREGRIETVDIERYVSRPIADDLSRLRHDPLDAHSLDILDVHDGHPGFVREPPEDLGWAADADLDRSLGVEDAGEHRLAERPAMVELGPVDLAHRVAMGVDMDEADRAVMPQ